MTSDYDSTNLSPDALPDDIQVPVHFDLGAMTLPLKTLQAIQPGFIFELQADPSSPVVISVNGRNIGRGELVLVDGRLAIRFNEATHHESS